MLLQRFCSSVMSVTSHSQYSRQHTHKHLPPCRQIETSCSMEWWFSVTSDCRDVTSFELASFITLLLLPSFIDASRWRKEVTELGGDNVGRQQQFQGALCQGEGGGRRGYPPDDDFVSFRENRWSKLLERPLRSFHFLKQILNYTAKLEILKY